ncbi:hypothetical protein, partial [Enterobacter cloacae complex sp. 2DZ2F20B]|uniref:hypothetical protein n=1 Tax=Enterobacter cloacae complex sp. 2DZ2F20B TaxID=2511993 RepID=UPI0010275878
MALIFSHILNSKVFNNYRFLVTSDFEPIGARNVFPCFDEPDFKAQFTINV